MAADAVEIAVGQHAQQPRLQFLRHVADLVKEQRAALGLLETAAAHVLGAGEGAALVAEQFGLQQLLRDRRGVDGDERPTRSRAVAVQRARHQFLAGARLAGDHHRRVGLRQAADRAEHLLHRRRLAEYLRHRFADFAGGVLAHALVHRTADQFDRMINIEGFGQVFVGAALEGGHRAFEVGVGGHDDDRQRRVARLGLLQQFKAGFPRHADVADHHLRRLLVERGQRLACGGKHLEGDVLARQCLLEHPAYRAVVVNDPDWFHGVSQSFIGFGTQAARVRPAALRGCRPAPATAV